ncbi:hypothetical protein ACF0H5_023273 [Mactra antiquata]
MPAIIDDGFTDCDVLCDPNNGYSYSCHDKCPGFEYPPSVDTETSNISSFPWMDLIYPFIGCFALATVSLVCYKYRVKLRSVARETVNELTTRASSIISGLNVFNDATREVFNTSNEHTDNVSNNELSEIHEGARLNSDMIVVEAPVPGYPVQDTHMPGDDVDGSVDTVSDVSELIRDGIDVDDSADTVSDVSELIRDGIDVDEVVNDFETERKSLLRIVIDLFQ